MANSDATAVSTAVPSTPLDLRRLEQIRARGARRRRSPGEGSVYRVGDRWKGVLAWHEDDSPKQLRRYVSGTTSAEARAKLNVLIAALKAGTLATAATPKQLLGDYLRGWIEIHRSHVRPSTWRTDESYVRVYLIPSMGTIALAKLTAAHVDKALAGFVTHGRPGKPGRPVAGITARHVRATLRTALAAAMRDGLVNRNAAADSRPPRVPHRAVTYLPTPALRELLDATADEPLGPLYAMAALTGLRRGELLALRWSDVADGTLWVRRSVSRNVDGGWSAAETKTNGSRRNLPLGGMALAALDRQRHRQEADEGAAGRAAWQNRDGLIFTDPVGRPLLPERVSHEFARTCRAHGGPTIRFHDLRHSIATMQLELGIPMAVISRQLGHSSITTTTAYYAEVTPELQRNAAEAVDRALGG